MKALALVEAPDHVCGRYRVSAFAPALDSSGWGIRVEGIASGTLARLRQLRSAARFDSVLIQRKLIPAWQWSILRRASRRLIFDFDDAVLFRDSYSPRGHESPRRRSRFARIARSADLMIAGNEFLAECARDCGTRSDRVRVIPTCVDLSKYRPKEGNSSPGNLIVRLVWVGSSSTLQGLESRKDLLERIGREVKGLRLRIVSDRYPSFESLAIEPVPWSRNGESEAIASADIGISLTPDDLWTRGKCGLKLIQYGAAGLPIVADPVGVHPSIVTPGVSGYLPRTDDEWVEAIRSLALDPAARVRMGHAARLRIEKDYALNVWAGAFVSAIAGGTAPHAPRNPTLLTARRVERR